MLLVIPAIDLRGGRCVRLYQGSYERETVYFDDPVKMARLWRVQNARVLHVVDLDAARNQGHNREVIGAICQALDIPVQVGGGIRTLEDIEALLAQGVYRVVLGTAAVREPDLISEALARYGCSRIVVGIDARDGEVRIEGWTSGSGVDAIALALDMEQRGVRRFVYTDISRDGTLEGPNIEMYRALGRRLQKARITASGGVSGYRDLMRLQELEPYRVDSVIIGRALYENRFPCQQFWCWHHKDEVDLTRFSTAPLKRDVTLP
ncbi:1-(5-phosphoribosyl)-5-[(5-phosphoribosylamino)methylideneamino]imidazole-4-carboxamide isomerase [Rhodothermus bifroesti]|uniref:1-(5-phosphoribosyl)-5-[(5-phosphoribosylamino)methylideneamino] imidazole-4-carboxamide isomerase n=1 Tax=Rhodothermus marinus TaxID=29549 RepID=A0A7V2F562_RHOMR|nr:1-(5-phosphoribosyl)-5-[(5-phosphoribosylamino)methylideneamino]imidazole-4-carboxamide isomerase [Rhodothermus bifroesti]GBD02396.1 Phosphoribosyl isomerase A [bacterium HR18]